MNELLDIVGHVARWITVAHDEGDHLHCDPDTCLEAHQLHYGENKG